MNKGNLTLDRILAFTLLFSTVFSIGGIGTFIASAQSTNEVSLPRSFTFQNNMQQGQTRNPDVSFLKRFLNNDIRTELNDISPCISTDVVSDTSNYFDARTKDAVIRFQNLFQNEILAPAGLTIGTGLFGQLTRTKVNQLLNTEKYANIKLATSTSDTSAIDKYFSNAVTTLNTGSLSTTSQTYNDPLINEYLGSISNALSNVQLTTPPATTTETVTTGVLTGPLSGSAYQAGTSSDPVVQSYYTYLDQVVGNAIKNVDNNVSGTVRTTPAVTSSAQGDTSGAQAVNSYYTYVNQIIGGNLAVTSNTSSGLLYATPVTPDPTATNYLNDLTAALYGTGPTSASSALLNATITAPFPVLLGITPTAISNCNQTITLTGRNFATTTNILFGTLGTLEATSTQTYSPSLGIMVDTITFSLVQFSNYYDFQKVYAGTTQNIVIHIASNNLTPDESAVVQYTFPGTPTPVTINNSDGGAAETPEMPETSANSGNNGPNTKAPEHNANTNGATGILKTMETTDKKIFTYTPQGYLIKLVGGDKAVDFVYSISPNGHLNQKLQGKLPGLMNLTGKNSNGSSGGILGALGIGAAAGAMAAGGAGAGGTTGGALTGFGGPITESFYCDCTSNWLITLQDRRTKTQLQLIYQDGASRLRSGYMIYTAGVQTLGLYTAGGQCQYYVYPQCTTKGSPSGTIYDVGTSYR